MQEEVEELHKETARTKQHHSSTARSSQLLQASDSGDRHQFEVKPGRNAFARRRVGDRAASLAVPDPVAEERHRLTSNAFYQQQQQRKSSRCEKPASPSLSASTSSPMVSTPLNNSEETKQMKPAGKDRMVVGRSKKKRFSGNLETLRVRTREAEMPERPTTAMSHFIRDNSRKDNDSDEEEFGDIVMRREKGILKLLPEGKESEDYSTVTFRSKIEGRAEGRMLKMMRGSPLTSPIGSNRKYDDGVAFYGSPPKPGSVTADKVTSRSDRTYHSSSRALRSPRKKFLGLNITVPNFKANMTASSTTDTGVPTTSNRVVPPKAAQVLGTEETPPTASSRYEKIRAQPYNMLKRLDTSISLPVIGESRTPKPLDERHNRTPILRHRKRLNKSAGLYDLSKTSLMDLSDDDLEDDEHLCSEETGKQLDIRINRSDSLHYYNDDSPPTPPAKNTPPKNSQIDAKVEEANDKDKDKVKETKKMERKEVSRHQVLDAVAAEKVPAIIGDGKSSPTRGGRYGHSGCVDISESPRISSVRASIMNATVIDEEEANKNDHIDGDDSRVNGIRGINECYDEGSECNGAGQANQLLPTFYSPSNYSIAFDAPQFRPSHNQDSSRYYISSPPNYSDVNKGAAYKDMKSEQMLEAKQKSVPSAESTPLHVEEHKDNTFTFGLGQSESNMNNELGITEEASMPARSAMIKDEMSTPGTRAIASPMNMQHEMNSIMGDFTGFCPSAVPTPLMDNHPAGMLDHLPPLPPLLPALPSGSHSVSDRPDPQSIITHFDIVHHHMERSAVTLHQSMTASMDVMMANILKRIDESAQATRLNETQRIENTKNLVKEVEGLKKSIEGLAVKVDGINKTTIKGMGDKLQTVVSANAKMGKTMEAMASKIGELEKKLESSQANQQERQTQLQKDLRELQHYQRSDTPLESNKFGGINNFSGSAQTTLQHSPTHVSPIRSAVSASMAATSTAPPFPSVPATMSWPGYDYNYSYNYTTPAAFPLSRQQFQQMDPQSRRAYVANHALQLATPDISQHPAFAGSGLSGGSGASLSGAASSANGGYYEHGYGYGAR